MHCYALQDAEPIVQDEHIIRPKSKDCSNFKKPSPTLAVLPYDYPPDMIPAANQEALNVNQTVPPLVTIAGEVVPDVSLQSPGEIAAQSPEAVGPASGEADITTTYG